MFVPDMDASVRFYNLGLGLPIRESFDDIVGYRPAGALPFRVASVFMEAGEGRFVELHPNPNRLLHGSNAF